MKRISLLSSSFPETRASRSRFACGASRGFTLVELLVVLGIMALLMSIALPSLLGSFRASGLTDAGNQFDNMAIMARENALSHNDRIALVLVTTDPSNPALSNRAISVWEMGSNQVWTQTSRWTILPSSVKAYDDPSISGTTSAGFPGTAPAIILNGNTIPTGDYSAFIFNPEGNMYQPTTATTRVASVEYGTDPPPVGSVNTSLNNYYDLVFSSDTGAVHVVRR